MGLQKEFNHDSGIKINYWNIGKLEITKKKCIAKIVMYGFVNQEVSNMGKQNLVEKYFMVDNQENKYNQYFGLEVLNVGDKNIYQLGYEYLKENEPFFAGAEDVLEV